MNDGTPNNQITSFEDQSAFSQLKKLPLTAYRRWPGWSCGRKCIARTRTTIQFSEQFL
jgi:hypothetical protein